MRVSITIIALISSLNPACAAETGAGRVPCGELTYISLQTSPNTGEDILFLMDKSGNSWVGGSYRHGHQLTSPNPFSLKDGLSFAYSGNQDLISQGQVLLFNRSTGLVVVLASDDFHELRRVRCSIAQKRD